MKIFQKIRKKIFCLKKGGGTGGGGGNAPFFPVKSDTIFFFFSYQNISIFFWSSTAFVTKPILFCQSGTCTHPKNMKVFRPIFSLSHNHSHLIAIFALNSVGSRAFRSQKSIWAGGQKIVNCT